MPAQPEGEAGLRVRPERACEALVLSVVLPSAALAGASETALAQTLEAPTLQVGVTDGGIQLDGRLDEDVWSLADSIGTLSMSEPVEGGTLVGRTTVRVLASPGDLLIGIVAYDPDPAGIVSVSKQRDPPLRGEDHILLVFDTFRDGRSGYAFGLTPGGARYDALISGQGERQSADWDGVWEAATAVGEWGWSAEIRIPLITLSFGEGLEEWGFNVERRVERLQEVSRWASPRRDYRVTQTARAGKLTGIPRFDIGIGLSVRPALVTGAGVPDVGADTETSLEPSVDVVQRFGTNVAASLTLNTDFAETEVDTRRTNLTRFPLFFQEKRTFFLEGSDIFRFGFGLGSDVLPLSWLRTMRWELFNTLVTDLRGGWESYRIFTAPVNAGFESGDRLEVNAAWEGERLREPFEISEGVVIPAGSDGPSIPWATCSSCTITTSAIWASAG